MFRLLILSLCFTASAWGEQNWPRFRGPNGSGLSDSKTVPVKWSEKEIRWKQKLPGSGNASPIVWKDQVYITAADSSHRRLLCLNAADGSVR